MKRKLIFVFIIFILPIANVYANEEVTFSKCVDGDTFKVILNEEEYTVRMLAVDTPETVHPTKGVEYYGKEASNYTCDKLTNAKKIELEYDANSDKNDKYDRLLAWVFVDDELLQELLVENGYAKVAYLYDDYKYTNLLEEKQELASAKNIGIWNTEAANNYDGEVMDTTIEKKDGEETNDYTKFDIVTVAILLFIIIFIGDKTIKSKAKKKLKKYL